MRNERVWREGRFVAAGTSRPLGAETLEYIARHLLDFLSDRTPGLRWVLSRAEVHVSMHGEPFPERTTLHLQDKDANLFAELAIVDDEKKLWIQELARHMST